MLYFVQQFGRNWLQIREHRPKCCTKCNIEPLIRFIPPFLLYKIQHLLTLFADSLANSAVSTRRIFNTAGETADDEGIARHRRPT
ncbi:hypothetical protein [Paenibacillus ginsengihumi]|uniref:hypothetical protein n=1 Tax=Paenibacillus ginsengihumi TaxID=431596 RepID=UPI000A070A1F|nr:hypothetical protein [Paenibacillus ginsengihumi]